MALQILGEYLHSFYYEVKDLKILTSFLFITLFFRFNVRCAILFIFSVTTAVCIALVPNISLGLDQEMSMPDDSYVLKYFDVSSKQYQHVKDLYYHSYF